MRKVRISELWERLRRWLGQAPAADEERLAALEREGIIRRGTGRLPPGFLDEPLPGKGARVLEAVLEEREAGW
jgi:hypothetical protein